MKVGISLMYVVGDDTHAFVITGFEPVSYSLRPANSNQLLQRDRTMLVASHNYKLALEASIIRSLQERKIDGVAVVSQRQ